jgi:hypothetical protein
VTVHFVPKTCTRSLREQHLPCLDPVAVVAAMSDGAAGGPIGEDEGGGREHDRFLPVANIRRVLYRRASRCTLPAATPALHTCLLLCKALL